ncbi:MAG: hypothetical protein AB7J30_09205 [Hyphomicrobium sp.]|uniref:hypothetical protein n=1 Tax=Hyphomicrobium sp. TaxID=82 RepID=UPI003D0DAA82
MRQFAELRDARVFRRARRAIGKVPDMSQMETELRLAEKVFSAAERDLTEMLDELEREAHFASRATPAVP